MCYGALLFIAQLFSGKAKLWVKGRNRWRGELKGIGKGKPVIWVHVASHGEFEQGKLVIDGLFKQYQDHHLLLTFFSPSGYELLKNYEGAHTVAYLPLDSVKQARDFIGIVQPQIALFVKYEFWYNYLNECFKNKIPVVFFSSSFRKNQVFFGFFGKWFLNHLKQCNYFFVRDEGSKSLLKNAGVNQCEVGGDTRIDSVLENTKAGNKLTDIQEFVGDKKLVIFGSTWPEDHQVILPWLNQLSKNVKVIVAPHEIDEEKIISFQNSIKADVSLYTKGDFDQAQILILDCVGVLKQLYRFSSVNYVGGGFGTGIHNLLEPTSFGKPVVFGPNHKKFLEAEELIELGAGFEVTKQEDLSKIMDVLIEGSGTWDNQKLKAYFTKNSGATEKVLDYVAKIL